jgi:hypothetical protein
MFKLVVPPAWLNARRYRSFAAFAVVLTFAGAVLVSWSWSDSIGDLGTDGCYYMLMAEHYSPLVRASAAASEAAASSRFPPVYPLTLAWLGAAPDLFRAHMLTTAMLLCALLVFGLWMIGQRLRTDSAALIALCLALLPGTLNLALTINSEFLYLLISVLALTLIDIARRSGRPALLLAAALAVALASLTRTIGVCLFVPLVAVALHQRSRGALLAMLVGALPILEWHLLHRSTFGYASIFSSSYQDNVLSGLIRQTGEEFPALRRGFEANFVTEGLAPALPVLPVHSVLGDLLGVACLAALGQRACGLRTEALYLVAYLCLLVVWPFPEDAKRLLWPALPLLLAQPLLVVREWPRFRAKFDSELQPVVLAAAAMLTMATPAVAFAAECYRDASFTHLPGAREYVGWYRLDRDSAADEVLTQSTEIAAIGRIQDEIPEQACVLATRPDFINYFANRRAETPPPDSVPDPEFANLLRSSRCRFVFMSNVSDKLFPHPLHPLHRLNGPLHVLDYDREMAAPPRQGYALCILAALD